MPCVCELLGGPLVLNGWAGQNETPFAGRHRGIERDGSIALRALDACLGVPGVPQSATGQTALFTGLNAQALVGDHVTGHPTAALRKLIAEHSVLKRAAACGARVLFANAHSQQFWQMIRDGKRRLGASTLTALAAEVAIPDLSDLLDGQAVLWDITHELASTHLGYDLPVVTPEEAGSRLAALMTEHELVLYETFLPDLAGHRRLEAGWVLSRLDAFLGAVLAHRPLNVTVVVSSDHGNLEDETTRMHTTNPVPLLVVGPGVNRFQDATEITHVAPAILSLLGCRDG
jgi:hypothetical protein